MASAPRLVSERGHCVGEDHPNAKLNWADVELMRALHDEGLPMTHIAKKFELPWSTVRDVCRYLTWTDLPVKIARYSTTRTRAEARVLQSVSAMG